MNTLLSFQMDDLKYKIKIVIGGYEDIVPLLRLINKSIEQGKKLSECYDYVLFENYFHNIPSKESIEKLADKVAEDTLAYIEKQAAKNKV